MLSIKVFDEFLKNEDDVQDLACPYDCYSTEYDIEMSSGGMETAALAEYFSSARLVDSNSSWASSEAAEEAGQGQMDVR